MAVSGTDVRDFFDRLNLPWPEVTGELKAELGATRFSRVLSVERFPQYENVRYLPPTHPNRRAPASFSVALDEEGEPIVEEWHELSDAEWKTVLEVYEKAYAEWNRTGGLHRVKTGPDRIVVVFTTENGAHVRGSWSGREWMWLSWYWTAADDEA